jgi:type IV pilus assembly protein PilC
MMDRSEIEIRSSARKGEKASRKADGKSAAAKPLAWKPFSGINQEDLLLFTRQLGTMINSGINLIYAFDTLARQVDKEAMHRVLSSINYSIQSGFTLSRALMEHPSVFNHIYVGLVRTGEAYGDLPRSLENLEHFLQREVNIKKKVIQSATYPLFALSLCLLFGLFTFKFILPSFVTFFKDLNVELPLPTKIMCLMTTIVDKPLFFFGSILIIAFIIFLFRRYALTEGGRLHIDRLLIQCPYFGPVLKKISVARLTNSLSALLEGGVDIRRALELSGKSSGNAYFELAMKSAGMMLAEGTSLSQYFSSQQGLFGPVLPSMIIVGEESGDLAPMLKKISQMNEQDVENSLDSLTVMLEPLLILFTGTIIGFIIISVFLPLYTILNKLG